MEVDEPLEKDRQATTTDIVKPSYFAPAKPTSPAQASGRFYLRPPVSTRKPVVLVPDSDISGSQSQSHSHPQSQSLTQPSISQRSAPSQQRARDDGPTSPLPPSTVPESSYLKSGALFSKPQALSRPNEIQNRDDGDAAIRSDLESDDEAAQAILSSGGINPGPTSPRRRGNSTHAALVDPGSATVSHPDVRARRSPIPPGGSQELPQDQLTVVEPRPDSLDAGVVSCGAIGRASYGTKRARGLKDRSPPGTDMEQAVPSPKRQKTVPEEVVVERVDHDPRVWKDPSFVLSAKRGAQRTAGTAREQGDHEHGTVIL